LFVNFARHSCAICARLGHALLAGFVFLGLWHVPPLHWRWLFWIPAMIATAAAK
jgi:sugar phosphate permease